MAVWTRDELNKIGAAEELEIASLRSDGTLRKPVTIWVVRLGDDLYVRSMNGTTGSWYRGALTRHEGHIEAGGVDKNVDFVEVAEPKVNDQIDAVFRTKYHRYGTRIVGTIVTNQARAATLKLVPRGSDSNLLVENRTGE